jgi:broad specificity phosphatase PhoE
MSLIYFVTHPDVVIDKDIPIPRWDLSDVGVSRTKKLLKKDWIETIDVIFSSTEEKAKTTAKIVAEHLNLPFNQVESLGEMNRSSTGLLEEKEFWREVKKFFANPDESIRGWERAIDVQNRIVKAVRGVIENLPKESNILIAAHGANGALLLTHLKRKSISMEEEQPGDGGGNYFVFNKKMKLIQDWKPIDL